MPILSFPPARQSKPTRLQYDAKTGEPLYPFAPQDYQKIEIVGFRLENGEYLPVKVFVEGNLGTNTGDLQLRQTVGRQRVWLTGLACFVLGIWAVILLQ